MEPRITIVAYKPKDDKADELRQLMREHLPLLKSLDMVTDRPSIIMEAKNGTILEVFEWKSKAAIEQAHTNPLILEMWRKYAEVCEYTPIANVEEAADLFSEFTPFT